MRERSIWILAAAPMPSMTWGSAWRFTAWQLGATLIAAATTAAVAAAARSVAAVIADGQKGKRKKRLANDDSKLPERDICADDAKVAEGEYDDLAELEDLAAVASMPGQDGGREIRRRGDVVQHARNTPLASEDTAQEAISSNTGDVLPGRQRIYVKTYGCAHNSADSEFMMGLLRDYGYTFANDLEAADACIINSCTVKNPSQDTAVNLVKKARKAGKSVVLAGCVPSADAALSESLEGVSMLSVNQLDRVVEVVEEASRGHVVRLLGKNRPLPSLELPKVRRNSCIEIIPISGGCLGNCSYCKTKHARGKLSSYSEQDIVSRALQAAAEGVSEVWLASEDTGAYGIDLGTDITKLLSRVADALPLNVMLKLGMTNPPYMLAHIEGVAEVLRRPNVFEFLHVPIQSGSNQVLRTMVREYTAEDFRRLVDGLRVAVPEVLVCTDVICGFPAEAEEDHAATMALVEEYRFPVLNISQFYPRPGTPAARFKKLPSDVVKRRSTEMSALFESYSTFDHLEGREERVWFSETNDKYQQTVGHTKAYTKVVVAQNNELLGRSAIVRLRRPTKWHVEGEIIGDLR